MKMQKILLAVPALLLLGIGGAWAHGGGRVGVYVGPYWSPWFYPPPYYQPQVIVVPQQPPPVYVEQSEAPAEPAASGAQQYWYYCARAKAYYPYVKECSEGWQKVLPQPER